MKLNSFAVKDGSFLFQSKGTRNIVANRWYGVGKWFWKYNWTVYIAILDSYYSFTDRKGKSALAARSL